MPKRAKTKILRTVFHSKKPKENRNIAKKPEKFESHPIFQPNPFLGIGNSKYFYTGLWLAFLVGLAQGADLRQAILECDFEPPSSSKPLPSSEVTEASETSESSASEGSAKPLLFSQHVRSTVHPGLYLMKNDISQNREVSHKLIKRFGKAQTKPLLEENPLLLLYAEDIVNRELNRPQNPKLTIYKEAIQQDPDVNNMHRSVRGSLEIDQSYNEAEPSARFAHDSAIDFLERSVLPKPIQNLQSEELGSILAKLNYMITPVDERNDQFVSNEQSLYRDQAMVVQKVPGFPGLGKGDKTIAYLREHAPNEIAAYESYIELHNQFYLERARNQDNEKFLKKDIFKIIAGNNNRVKKFIDKYITTCPHPDSIPKLMREFLQNLGRKLQDPKRDAIQIAAYAHMELVRIHPFAEANGRTARALMNTILLQNELPAIGFLKNKEYMEAVSNSASSGNSKEFEELLRREVKKANEDPTKGKLESFPSKMKKCLDKCHNLCVVQCEDQLKEMVAKLESRATSRKRLL